MLANSCNGMFTHISMLYCSASMWEIKNKEERWNGRDIECTVSYCYHKQRMMETDVKIYVPVVGDIVLNQSGRYMHAKRICFEHLVESGNIDIWAYLTNGIDMANEYICCIRSCDDLENKNIDEDLKKEIVWALEHGILDFEKRLTGV